MGGGLKEVGCCCVYAKVAREGDGGCGASAGALVWWVLRPGAFVVRMTLDGFRLLH